MSSRYSSSKEEQYEKEAAAELDMCGNEVAG
jgi:hypothetical protein